MPEPWAPALLFVMVMVKGLRFEDGFISSPGADWDGSRFPIY
jgi:hypothetical protein